MRVLGLISPGPPILLLIWPKNYYPHFPYWFNDSPDLPPSQKYFEFPARGKLKIFGHSYPVPLFQMFWIVPACLKNSYICKITKPTFHTSKCFEFFPLARKILTFASYDTNALPTFVPAQRYKHWQTLNMYAPTYGCIWNSSIIFFYILLFVRCVMASSIPKYLYDGLIKKIWSLYRGRQAGKLVKSKETLRRFTIELVHRRATNSANHWPLFTNKCEGVTAKGGISLFDVYPVFFNIFFGVTFESCTLNEYKPVKES